MAQPTVELSDQQDKPILRTTNTTAMVNLPKPTLIEKCISLGLDVTGTKEALATRIADFNKSHSTAEDDGQRARQDSNDSLIIMQRMIENQSRMFERLLANSQSPTPPPSSELLNSLPTYEAAPAEYLQAWIHRLEDTQEQQNWSNETLLSVAKTKLLGTAREWNDVIGKHYKSWTEWQQRLQHIFGRNKTIMTWATAAVNNTQRPNEDIASYLFSRMKLAE